MIAWRQSSALLALLFLGGCVTQQPGDYERWRDFHVAVNAMNDEERRARYDELSELYERVPGTVTRLQLAYLMTREMAPPSTASPDLDINALLEGVSDSHELVPIRDQLRQYLELRASFERERARLGEARRQCEALNTQLGGLRDEREALQEEITTCKDQLEALKEIESMMSASDESLEVLP